MDISGTNVTISFNRFSNLARGITLFGDDPEYGTNTGILHGAALIDNRFCSVGTNVVAEPLVTGVTEEGSHTCPFSPPALAIAPAVLLTWPAADSGYAVECATNAAGPWVPLGIAPTIIGNEATVAVRTTTAAKFFRLRSP